MAGIKLYRAEEVVREYVYSWRIKDEETIAAMQNLMKEHSDSLQSILTCLEQYVQSQISGFAFASSLPAEQALALAKLIYLQEKLYQKVNIFIPGNRKNDLEQLLNQCWHRYALPATHPSVMAPQAIRIYNPFMRLKFFIQRMIQHVRKQ